MTEQTTRNQFIKIRGANVNNLKKSECRYSEK